MGRALPVRITQARLVEGIHLPPRSTRPDRSAAGEPQLASAAAVGRRPWSWPSPSSSSLRCTSSCARLRRPGDRAPRSRAQPRRAHPRRRHRRRPGRPGPCRTPTRRLRLRRTLHPPRLRRSTPSTRRRPPRPTPPARPRPLAPAVPPRRGRGPVVRPPCCPGRRDVRLVTPGPVRVRPDVCTSFGRDRPGWALTFGTSRPRPPDPTITR